MSLNLTEKLSASLKSGIRNLANKLDPRDSFKNTGRKLQRVMDEMVVSPQELAASFEKIEHEAIQRGDRVLLVKKVDDFDNRILQLVKRNENAQYGVLVNIHDKIKEIRAKKQRFSKEIEALARQKNIPKEACIELKKIVDEEFTIIFNFIAKTLEEIEKQEIMVSRERDQLRSFLLRYDSSIKHQLGFFYQRIKDLDKSMSKNFDSTEKGLRPKVISADIKRAKETLKQMLKEIEKIVETEVREMLIETKTLVHLILGIEQALIEVIDVEIKQKLEGNMKLPHETGEQMIAKINQVFKGIQMTSEVNYQNAKKEEQLANAA